MTEMCVVLIIVWSMFFLSSGRRHTSCALVTGVQTCALPIWREPRRRPLAAPSDARIARAEAAIASLPERTREVFFLHRFEDLSYERIARRLDIDVKEVEGTYRGNAGCTAPRPERLGLAAQRIAQRRCRDFALEDRKSTRLNSSH